MRHIALLAICLVAATAASAQKNKAPSGPGVKSKAEMAAVNGIVQATTPDARIAAVDNLITKFASTDYKSIALFMAADAYEQKGDHAKAIVYAEQALQADPKNYSAEILTATVTAGQIKDTDLDKAEKIATVEKAAKEGLETLGTAQKSPLFPQTDAQFEQSKKQQASLAWVALGMVATVQKKVPEAVEDYEKGLALDPDPVLMIRVGRALETQKKYDEAIAWLDKAIASPDASAQIKDIATKDKARMTRAKG